MPKLKRPTKPKFDLQGFANEYFSFRTARERFTKLEGEYKKKLMEYLTENGEEIEGGHRVASLPEPIEFGEKTVTGIERKKRVSTSLDEDATLALLAKKQLLDQCTTTIVVVDEDAILAANSTVTSPTRNWQRSTPRRRTTPSTRCSTDRAVLS